MENKEVVQLLIEQVKARDEVIKELIEINKSKQNKPELIVILTIATFMFVIMLTMIFSYFFSNYDYAASNTSINNSNYVENVGNSNEDEK